LLLAQSNEKKNLHLTRQAERALKTTFLEAKLFQSTSINTAHLLLCILRNENDPTTKLLNKLKS
jgi:ATP-dependent Clp protease ATP-binding subunit ClpC